MNNAIKKSYIIEEQKAMQLKEDATLKFHNIQKAFEERGSLLEAIADVRMLINELSSSLENTEKNDSNKSSDSKEDVADKKIDFFQIEETSKPLKRAKKYNSNNYFDVKNHSELFDLGKYFLQLNNNEKKNFGFYCDSNELLAQTMVGLSAFFNYHENKKVTMIVDRYESSSYKKLLPLEHVEAHKINEEVELDYIVSGGVELIEMNQLKHVFYKYGSEVFSRVIKEILEESDLVFSEFPKMQEIEKDRELYFDLNRSIDSLILIANKGASKAKDFKKVIDYSRKYNVPVEGVVFGI